MTRTTLATWIAAIVAIDVIGLGVLGATWALAGGGSGGLGPYLQAVGEASVSPWALARYCAIIACYSAGLEFVLRRLIQRPISTRGRWGAHLAGPVAALVYGLTHAIYHPAGVFYALVLGGVTATAFARLKDWRPLALWHVQWNALAIGGTLLLALWGPGDPRTAALVAYKADQIREGKLVYAEDWGWVDRTHLAHDQLDRAEAWAQGHAGDELRLEAAVSDILGGRTPVVRTYDLRVPARTEEAVWATACAVVIDFNRDYESAQQARPWWTGAPMSAFQFEDLPSVLRACLDRRPGASPPSLQTDVASLLRRWEAEGPSRVAEPVRDLALPIVITRAGQQRVARR